MTVATFTNSKGEWWMPDGKTEAYQEGYKALYAMDEEVYLENPYKRETQANSDWYDGHFDALATHW